MYNTIRPSIARLALTLTIGSGVLFGLSAAAPSASATGGTWPNGKQVGGPASKTEQPSETDFSLLSEVYLLLTALF
jgi:hypothetical protein